MVTDRGGACFHGSPPPSATVIHITVAVERGRRLRESGQRKNSPPGTGARDIRN